LNIDELNIKEKNKIEPYEFKIWYNKNYYTRSQIVKNEENILLYMVFILDILI
jgi:hypothetical protein